MEKPQDGRWEDTFVIITDDPNTKMSEIHDTQAFILDPREYAGWLNESERPLLHLLRILQEDDLVIDPIRVETVVEKPQPPQLGLFG